MSARAYVVLAWIFFALGALSGMVIPKSERAAAWPLRTYCIAMAVWWLGLAIYARLASSSPPADRGDRNG